VSAPHTDELYCEENPPVPLTDADRVELHSLIPPLYRNAHRVSPQQAVNLYCAYVAAGLQECANFLAGQAHRRVS
jgi:hypothetical protein